MVLAAGKENLAGARRQCLRTC